jgi:hypothetical protein
MKVFFKKGIKGIANFLSLYNKVAYISKNYFIYMGSTTGSMGFIINSGSSHTRHMAVLGHIIIMDMSLELFFIKRN